MSPDCLLYALAYWGIYTCFGVTANKAYAVSMVQKNVIRKTLQYHCHVLNPPYPVVIQNLVIDTPNTRSTYKSRLSFGLAACGIESGHVAGGPRDKYIYIFF